MTFDDALRIIARRTPLPEPIAEQVRQLQARDAESARLAHGRALAAAVDADSLTVDGRSVKL